MKTITKPKTLSVLKEHRIEELREDILVVDFHIEHARNPYSIKALAKLKGVLKRSIFALEKNSRNA